MPVMTEEKTKIQLIGLKNVTVDPEIQSRVKCDPEWERRFAGFMERGDVFPPIDVFWDGKTYWLADGFHRTGATWHTGEQQIRCRVHSGSRDDAIIFSAGCNKECSIPRKRADIRKAAEMLFSYREWRYKSAQQVGRYIGISGSTVTTWRTAYCRKNKLPVPAKIETANGIKRKSHSSKPDLIWQDSDGKWFCKIDGHKVPLTSSYRSDAGFEARRLMDNYFATKIKQAQKIENEAIENEEIPVDELVRRTKDLEAISIKRAKSMSRQVWTVESLVQRLRKGLRAFWRVERDESIAGHIAISKDGAFRPYVDWESNECRKSSPDKDLVEAIVIPLAKWQTGFPSEWYLDVAGAIGSCLFLIQDYAPRIPRLIIACEYEMDLTTEMWAMNRETFPLKIEFMRADEIEDAFRRRQADQPDITS